MRAKVNRLVRQLESNQDPDEQPTGVTGEAMSMPGKMRHAINDGVAGVHALAVKMQKHLSSPLVACEIISTTRLFDAVSWEIRIHSIHVADCRERLNKDEKAGVTVARMVFFRKELEKQERVLAGLLVWNTLGSDELLARYYNDARGSMEVIIMALKMVDISGVPRPYYDSPLWARPINVVRGVEFLQVTGSWATTLFDGVMLRAHRDCRTCEPRLSTSVMSVPDPSEASIGPDSGQGTGTALVLDNTATPTPSGETGPQEDLEGDHGRRGLAVAWHGRRVRANSVETKTWIERVDEICM